MALILLTLEGFLKMKKLKNITYANIDWSKQRPPKNVTFNKKDWIVLALSVAAIVYVISGIYGQFLN